VHERKKIPFTKMSGAGNDFVVIDNRSGIIKNNAEFAKIICDRKWGIGADGILLIEKSSRADFTMRYYNADGSYGGMCGNGGRCISRFAFIHHITTQPSFSFEALDHIYLARIEESNVLLTMKDPTDIMLRQKVLFEANKILYHYVNTGSPHCVIFLHENTHAFTTNLTDISVEQVGRRIRNDKAFAQVNGVNVNFVYINSKTSITIRTYERGVEAETLACGTGSIASAVAAHLTGQTSPECSVHTKSGEELKVNFKIKDGKIFDVTLFGSAHVMFEGTILYDWSTNKLMS
jgi:diaminopimelate epimerase